MFSLKTGLRKFIIILILILGYNVYRNPAFLVGQTPTASSPGGSDAMHYKKQYQFSEDWFTYNIPVWQSMFERFKGKENLRYLRNRCVRGPFGDLDARKCS